MRSLKNILMAAALVAVCSFSFAKAVTVKAAAYNSEDRHLSGFNAVSVSGSFDVYITQGASESVKVEAPSNIINRIVTEVQGGVLKIYTKNNNGFNWSFGNKKIVVYVAIKNVNCVSLGGSGDVYFKDGLKAPSLALKLNGSGDLTGKVEVKSLETSLSGSGDIRVTGRAEISTVSVVGSGDFTGQNLITNNTSVRISGSGDASINAAEKIDASVAGSGDVRYTGNAKNVSSSKAGSGSVYRM